MKIILTLAIGIALSANQLFAQQKEFGWLVGTWKLKDKNAFEHWVYREKENVLYGISYRIKNTADTVVTEEITLKFQDNSFYYIPDVAGVQGPVPFKITQYTAVTFTAENPAHDFPKIIRYKFIQQGGEDINEASIEGNGKVISYTFVRVK
ncbi:hypothetical protein ACFQ21_24655 [Ohtaekwangia kribbensis]|jgi:hypothetical protein|uniref:DUF5004 domain-containing protein n=1 Tax=Ohtaekwangia kribbensis TaxID=688913 RepID=A0ABW3K8Q4_9BACT